MGEIRTRNPAFHPNGPQKIIRANDAVFTVLRTSPDGSRKVLALINVTAKSQEVRVSGEQLGVEADSWRDLLSETTLPYEEGALRCKLIPYQVLWLEPR
jgi:sucrose phosphorylase